MKTKSIREEEMDTGSDSNESSRDWEVFFGSEIPLPAGSKLTRGRGPVDDEKYVMSEALPEAEALTDSDGANFNQIIFEKVPYEFRSLHIPDNQPSLSDISWLNHVDLTATNSTLFIANSKGTLIPYRIAPLGWIIEHNREIHHTKWSSTVLQCRGNSTTDVSCEHLAHCVLNIFLHDFDLYKSSYWCPIRQDKQ
jgi:hypothetical protein